MSQIINNCSRILRPVMDKTIKTNGISKYFNLNLNYLKQNLNLNPMNSWFE
jgi:hypothetical protein